MFKGFGVALAVAAAAVVVDAALASSGTVYRQTSGTSPAKAPRIKYAKISNTKSGVTVGVCIHDVIVDSPRIAGGLVRVRVERAEDQVPILAGAVAIGEPEKLSAGVTTGVWKWNGSAFVKDTAASNSLKVVYYGAKGNYFAVTFPRSRFGIGQTFKFYVETMYCCTAKADSCTAGEFLPRGSKAVLTYKLK